MKAFYKRFGVLLIGAFLAILGVSLMLMHGVLMAYYYDEWFYIITDLCGLVVLGLFFRRAYAMLCEHALGTSKHATK